MSHARQQGTNSGTNMDISHARQQGTSNDLDSMLKLLTINMLRGMQQGHQ